MARTKGARDADYELKRRNLVTMIRDRLIQAGDTKPSLRKMAEGAGVTVPTLRHYFGSREDVIEAVLLDWREQGAVHLEHAAQPLDDVDLSVRQAVRDLILGLRDYGVGYIVAIGSVEGVLHPRLGPEFLSQILEPILAAFEQRLRVHIERGELIDCDPRHAALMLVSPLVVSVQHQLHLGGSRLRALDLDGFGEQLASAFLRAFRA